MIKLWPISLLIFLFTSSVFAQTLEARISNARVVGSEFLWDVEVNRTDDWGTGGGNDILGNCDFYFLINVNGFTSDNPTISNIHSSVDGNNNYTFATGRAGSGTQCYVALTYDSFGGGSNWYPPLNSWELLYTASLHIANTAENSGLGWYISSTGFARGNGLPLTAVLSIDGQSDISLPVELSSFKAIIVDNRIKLEWTTESELDNMGFEIFRSEEEYEDFELISSYKTNDDLKGSGSSSVQHTYSYEDKNIDHSGFYYYKLVDVDYAGQRTEHGPISVVLNAEDILAGDAQNPTKYSLSQNFPNPFNPSTKINFTLPATGSELTDVTLKVFDIKGQLVNVLTNGQLNAGTYQATWDGTDISGKSVSSGVYLYQLKTEHFNKSKRMFLVR